MNEEQIPDVEYVSNRVETLEESLAVIGEKIASQDFADQTRRAMEHGITSKYVLTVKLSNQGYIVNLSLDKMLPRKNIINHIRIS